MNSLAQRRGQRVGAERLQHDDALLGEVLLRRATAAAARIRSLSVVSPASWAAASRMLQQVVDERRGSALRRVGERRPCRAGRSGCASPAGRRAACRSGRAGRAGCSAGRRARTGCCAVLAPWRVVGLLALLGGTVLALPPSARPASSSRAASPRRPARSAARATRPPAPADTRQGRGPGRRCWPVSMWSTRPLAPTTIVARVGTIMIRPSLDQIGRSRSRPAGRRETRHDRFAVLAACSPHRPPNRRLGRRRTGHRHTADPSGPDPRDSITSSGKEKAQPVRTVV